MLVAALSVGAVEAQPVDSTLAPVEVSATPFSLEPARAPLSVATRIRSAVELASDPALTAEALGRGLPGVWISDRGNPSTGERVLVRGLGWRAAFGVRGTHVVLDGVALTLPDGQTPLTVLDPALVERVDVLRGPASIFWGSGSAGVLALTTRSNPGVRVRALGGAYGLRKAEVHVQPNIGTDRRVMAWASALDQTGYREHSAVKAYRGGVTSSTPWGGGTLGLVALGAWTPRAEAPGGITAEAFEADPRQTRSLVVEQDAHKRVAQGDVALTYARPLGGARLRTTLALGHRQLDNPIVPRVIELARWTGSLRMVAEGGDALAWGLGVEAERQRDDRFETSNDGGQPGRGVLTDQVETVQAGAVFGRLATRLTPALTATGAIRLDALRYRADVADGPGSGSRQIVAASPSLGLSYRRSGPRGSATAYANVAGALDAPTTTELGNQPDGSPGFNDDLQPERTWGAEAGLRASRVIGSGVVGVDAAVFAGWVDDLLQPAEVNEVTVYRNEGRARHVGLELGTSAEDLPAGPGRLDGAVALTLAQGTFLASPTSARVPGFPSRLATWTVTWHLPALAIGLDGEAASSYAADRAREQHTEAYAVLHARLAVPEVAVGSASVTPFVSLRNVTDATYAGSVVVNAFGGQFLEPAPGRHLAAGLSVAFE